MSKHTPGPWEACAPIHEHKRGESWISTVFANNGPDGGRIAAEAQSVTREMATANAQLIAAAPDLLAACKCWLEEMRMNCAPDDSAQMRLVLAAIAKAEGSTP